MTYLTDNLATLAWGALAGILAALFGFAWIWRTRDRQLARVGALAQLEASPSLDAEAKAVIGARIRNEVEDILEGDKSRRPFRVQQAFYLLLWAAAAALLVFGVGRPLPFKILLWVSAALLVVLAIGITNVPPHRWAMPHWLRSYQDETRERVPNDPWTRRALRELPAPHGDGPVVVVGQRRNLPAARDYAAGQRRVVLLCSPHVEAEFSYALVRHRRWDDVTVISGALERDPLHELPDGQPVAITDAVAVVVLERLADRPSGLLNAAGTLHGMLAIGGSAFVHVHGRVDRRHPTKDETMDALRTVFGPANVEEGRGRFGFRVARVVRAPG